MKHNTLLNDDWIWRGRIRSHCEVIHLFKIKYSDQPQNTINKTKKQFLETVHVRKTDTL